MKKLYLLITLLIISFVSFILILYIPKNYSIMYKIKKYQVQENYVNNKELYKIFINYNDKTFPFIIDKEYTKNRKIVQDVNVKKKSESICLIIKVFKNKYYSCYENDQLIDYNLLSYRDNDEVINQYNKTKIYNYNKLKFYIWNYHGYDYISGDKNQSIKILHKDEYDNFLAYQFQNYLIIPNYDSNYYFTELFIINNSNLEISNFNLNNEISFSTVILGDYKNDIYLLDKKNKVQYKINPKKHTTKVVGLLDKDGIIYQNGKLKNVSLNKIINNNLKFSNILRYNYYLDNHKLYLKISDYKILLSNKDIKEIIKIDNEKVYYLSNSTLYVYSPQSGEIKLLENNEWNFNYKNKIFIFN